MVLEEGDLVVSVLRIADDCERIGIDENIELQAKKQGLSDQVRDMVIRMRKCGAKHSHFR